MIVTVKNSNSKRGIIKVISFIAVIAMFVAYYFHMSAEFEKTQKAKIEQENKIKAQEEESIEAKKIEKLIYKEVETAIDLVGQEFIQNVKIVDNKILITCDISTNLDPIKVRYGTLALIKNDLSNIKVAIDIKYIIESSFNDK